MYDRFFIVRAGSSVGILDMRRECLFTVGAARSVQQNAGAIFASLPKPTLRLGEELLADLGVGSESGPALTADGKYRLSLTVPAWHKQINSKSVAKRLVPGNWVPDNSNFVPWALVGNGEVATPELQVPWWMAGHIVDVLAAVIRQASGTPVDKRPSSRRCLLL